MYRRKRRIGPGRNGPIAVLCAAALLGVGAHAGLAGAEDDRPSEIPYQTAGDIPSLSRAPQEERRVTVTDHGLLPENITLTPNDHLAWISYAGETTTIVFEREVAGSMACHSLVNFYIEDDELKSGEIHPLDVVRFCELAPGFYRYTVVRQNPASRAKRRMKGTITVRAM